MDERKPQKGKDDDTPIIGDYSEAANLRLRAQSSAAPPPPPSPPAATAPAPRASRASRPAGAEQWRLDPADVHRHERLARQREGGGPLRKFWRYASLALVLVGIIAVYWNFETLRRVSIDFPVLARLFADDTRVAGGGTRLFGGEPETVAVEAAGVVGTAAPTSIGDPPPAVEDALVEPLPAVPSGLPVAEAVPPPLAAPEPPVGPETFAFGLSVLNVSEADASAAVIILRSGGRRAPASITWWTTDETATAGVDYARLGTGVVRFAAGEQNRTIHIPIVGDRNVEGPETFYVNIAAGDSADTTAEPLQRLLVIINDDD